MKFLTFLLSGTLIIAGRTSGASTLETKTNGDPQIIILKLDDVVSNHSKEGLPVSARWQRIAEFLKESEIKASFGVIGFSLEEDDGAYFNWIKTVNESGLIEFWNHGYKAKKSSDEPGEFENHSVEMQRYALQRTQALAKEKLEIDLHLFGAHWSGVNKTTIEALSTIPEIKMLYYGPADSTRFVFKYVMTLENPVHVPDFEKFKSTYEEKGASEPYLALQGHPNSWDEQRWEEFVKIIRFLQSKGAVFMTPSEYAKTYISK